MTGYQLRGPSNGHQDDMLYWHCISVFYPQAKFVDVLCINRYYGWYSDMGHLEVIPYQLRYDLQNWYDTIRKPIIVSEYGADTVPGINSVRKFLSF